MRSLGWRADSPGRSGLAARRSATEGGGAGKARKGKGVIAKGRVVRGGRLDGKEVVGLEGGLAGEVRVGGEQVGD